MEIPKGQRTQFLVYVLLKDKDMSGLEKVIRETIRTELKDIAIVSEKETEEAHIPDQMLEFLTDLENA